MEFTPTIENILRKTFKILEYHGGQCYFVGGFVRDKILKRESKDIDIVICGMTLEEIEKALSPFGIAKNVGKSFGIIKFKHNDDLSIEFDLAVPRKDKLKPGGTLHTDFEIEIGKHISLKDDLYRRDFTMNAIAMTLNGDLIDPYGGLADIEDKVIRCVNPDVFTDDPLRILRAIRFSAQLKDFTIIHYVYQLMKNEADKLYHISPERIFEELNKIFKGVEQVSAIKMLHDIGFLGNNKLWDPLIFPDFPKSFFIRNPFLRDEEIEKTNKHFNNLQRCKTIGEFYFALVKPEVDSIDSMAWDVITSRFKKVNLPNSILVELEALIYLYKKINDNPDVDIVLLKSWLSVAVKIYPDFSPCNQFFSEEFQAMFVSMEVSNEPFTAKDLAITGGALMSLGYIGQEIAQAQGQLMRKVWSGEVPNDTVSLIEEAKQLSFSIKNGKL